MSIYNTLLKLELEALKINSCLFFVHVDFLKNSYNWILLINFKWWVLKFSRFIKTNHINGFVRPI